MSNPWNPDQEPVPFESPSDTLTLVAGQTFCATGRDGDITDAPHGLFFADLRAISRLRLRVDGNQLQALASAVDGASSATFVLRSLIPTRSGSRAFIVRRRRLGAGMSEQIEIRNYGRGTLDITLGLDVETDFADLFAVKEGRAAEPGERQIAVGVNTIDFSWQLEELRRRVRITFDGDLQAITESGVSWSVSVPPKTSATVGFRVDVALADEWMQDHRPVSARARAEAAAWLAAAPQLRTAHVGLALAFDRALEDLGSLRLFDTVHGGPPVIAAGAPWFMTLFGRDSLLTGWMALPVDPTLAYGVVRALADLQGRNDNPHTEEEPGRILHEVRLVDAASPSFRDGEAYFGTVDATPLFVVLVGELSRWGLPDDLLASLLPAVERAMTWIDRRTRAGGGYVAYRRLTSRGLTNQGWKDSWDGVRYHDGRVAKAPIALCEVQGYVYAAHLARAEIAVRLGDEARAQAERIAAAELKERFNRDFWCAELGWLGMGLDGEGRCIDALASNAGHCLWTGIVDDEHAAAVADRLTSAPMWSGWGLRTLAADEVAFDPTSYHCGSVWPHDNAIAAAGLMRAGFTEEAHRVILAQLAMAEVAHGRLPELLCGTDRADIPTPVPYPTSCSPQAWAAASPLMFLRTLLGFDPDVPSGVCRVAPRLPAEIHDIHLSGVRLWDHRLDVHVRDGAIEVRGLPASIELVEAARV